MKTLIVGGCGFVGSHLVDHLLEQGHSVHVVDVAPERYRLPNRRVKYHFLDYTNPTRLDELLNEGFESICHLASSTTPYTSNIDPSKDVTDNILGTLVLLDAAVRHQVTHMIYLSSGGTVYGNNRKSKLSENDLERPISSYGISKLAIEHYFRLYHSLYGLGYTILRLSNPFGARQNPESSQGAIPIFLNRLLKNEKVVIYGDGLNIRDYVFVGDVVNACGAALSKRKIGTYNIGSGAGVTLNSLVTTLSRLVGGVPEIEYLPERKFDVRSVVLDVSKAQNDLNWKPSSDFENKLEQSVAWVKEWQLKFREVATD